MQDTDLVRFDRVTTLRHDRQENKFKKRKTKQGTRQSVIQWQEEFPTSPIPAWDLTLFIDWFGVHAARQDVTLLVMISDGAGQSQIQWILIVMPITRIDNPLQHSFESNTIGTPQRHYNCLHFEVTLI